jgi:hypothetical protein
LSFYRQFEFLFWKVSGSCGPNGFICTESLSEWERIGTDAPAADRFTVETPSPPTIAELDPLGRHNGLKSDFAFLFMSYNINLFY